MQSSNGRRAPTRRGVLAAVAAGAALWGARPGRARATSMRRQVIVEETTGLAIGGYDPVAYFVDRQPRRGVTEFQLDWGGGTWLFVNDGNRAAFRDHPDVYAPAFAGYCAFAVAQGRPAEGSPLHFAIVDDRLLLFANAASRLAFLESAPRLAAEAARRWPEVARDLP